MMMWLFGGFVALTVFFGLCALRTEIIKQYHKEVEDEVDSLDPPL